MSVPPTPAADTNPDPRLISQFRVSRFKSIREQTLEFGRVNVLIGSNGAGKSNLIQALRALVYAADDRLDVFSQSLGANFFFYQKDANKGTIRLAASFLPLVENVSTYEVELGAHRERDILEATHESFTGGFPVFRNEKDRVAFRKAFWAKVNFHHLDNTSLSADIRSGGYIEDNRALHVDGSNLAACLYLIAQINPLAFGNIEANIRRVAPFFGHFQLSPYASNPDRIRLQWRAQGSDVLYTANSLSDGTLRFMALAALLMQPRERLPRLIVLDEPELGLHPAAIQLLGAMIRSASHHTQLIVSTQSVALVDQCTPADIVTVERERSSGESVFKRLPVAELEPWLAEYTLGELWEKNVLGARP